MTEEVAVTQVKEKKIELRPIELAMLEVKIKGKGTLITNKFSEKARRQILEGQQRGDKPKTKTRAVRDPEADFHGACYRMPDYTDDDPKFGFPANGIKAAMIDSGYRYMGLTKTDLRGDFHIDQDLVEIIAPYPEMREDIVRLAGPGRTADLRYRPGFQPWSMVVPITFKPNRLSEEQLLQMLDHAGFSCGLGEWRPSRNGEMGRFEIEGVYR